MSSFVDEMRVTKRNKSLEVISFDKILKRIKSIGKEQNLQNINYSALCLKIIDQLYDKIETTKIDELTAEQCASQTTKHPDFGVLAGAVVISNLHKNTKPNFLSVMKQLSSNNLVTNKLVDIASRHKDTINQVINYQRDNLIDYFGFKTLERAYLMRINKIIVERPQHMWMRVSIGIHGDNIEKIKETYEFMSQLCFTHATPTLFNAGTLRPQLSSCFLLSLEEDSINGIYNTLKDCALISKWAGGIGLHIHNLRSTGSHIRGTNGTSNGIIPMLRVFNMTARYVDQGGGKRNGSFAIYMEPWHGDIMEFLELKKNHGDEEMRARDLFYALWIPDLFMKRVKNDEEWCLFCPDQCPGLSDAYGDAFEELYNKYENENKFTKKIKARELWFQILDSQMETGTPYILYKDACNRKSNQKNIGTIKSSNLCTEIIEYSDKTESAVCNLASIALSKFVNEDKSFNYEKLHKVSKTVTYNLNKVIDVNYYPTEKTEKSNMRHRPIGVGVQGLADTFMLMDIPFTSDKAKETNKLIFETIYHASLEMSCELSKERYELFVNNNYSTSSEMIKSKHFNKYEAENINKINNKHIGAYSTFEGSPCSRGILQFDMWNVSPSDRYNWEHLKSNIMEYGIRNSLLLAPMPTASTSQILGNNECFEPFTSNIYTRRTLAGEFVMVNKYLMNELLELGVWNDDIKASIIENKGSIQHIEGLSDHIKEKYKIVWELPMKELINMAKDRGAFICQSQSLNLWLEDPTYNTLTSMHFYSWEQGLKTGIYYLRRKPKHQPQQFTIVPKEQKIDDEPCEMCSG
jgi:ribonucleotide reductase alpha subunit